MTHMDIVTSSVHTHKTSFRFQHTRTHTHTYTYILEKVHVAPFLLSLRLSSADSTVTSSVSNTNDF